MDTWAERGLISPSGKAFLVATLDPFHDSQIPDLKGYPDIETSPSLVRMIKQSITITKPAGLAAGNWDCQVVCWPWMKKMNFVETSVRFNNMITEISGSVQPLGGLQIFACPSSVGSFDLNLPTTVEAGALQIEDEILQGSNRLIGAGYEVHDITAEIYKQGAVCNYMMHNVPKDASLFVRPASVNPPPAVNPIASCFSGTSFRNIPRTTAEALLIPGSNEWAAKDGVYAVCRFAGVENPPYTVDYNLPVLFEVDDIPSSPSTSSAVSPPTFPNTSQIIIPNHALDSNSPASPAWKSFPVHTSGSIFTGLNENSSLRINFNVIIENFPGPRDQKDLSIATPSASFDPRTLEIYSHTLCHAPVAVPVGENPLGEWFMDVVGKVGNFLKVLPNPIASTIGSGMSYVADTMKPFMTTPSGANQKTIPNQKKKLPPATQPQAKATKTYTQGQWQSMSAAKRKEAKSLYKIVIVNGPPPNRK
jgi:hypothetical protein